jgi:putative transposase
MAKEMKLRNFQYRIYPTGKQKRQMEFVLIVCMRLWNYFLEQRDTAYKTEKKSISYFDQVKEIPKLAIKDPSIKDIYSQIMQDVPRRLDRAFQAFFRRIKAGETPGFPRFKHRNRYNSFTYPQNSGRFRLTEDGKIYLGKIGCVKIKYHRKAKGTWKTCTVKRTPTGKWYVVISCEQSDVAVPRSTKPAVGIDLGLKEFAVLSDGSKIKRARFFKAEEGALAKAQRKLEKQDKGTTARRKARKVVARIHERISDKRNDFTHQASRKIANTYGVICIEKLNINGMLENPSVVIQGKEISAKPLHRSILDVAWNQFGNQLGYKAEEAGGLVVRGNPVGTTKKCSACGKLKSMDLSQREYICSCGHKEDRDSNSSKNILAVGLHSLEVLKKVS